MILSSMYFSPLIALNLTTSHVAPVSIWKSTSGTPMIFIAVLILKGNVDCTACTDSLSGVSRTVKRDSPESLEKSLDTVLTKFRRSGFFFLSRCIQTLAKCSVLPHFCPMLPRDPLVAEQLSLRFSANIDRFSWLRCPSCSGFFIKVGSLTPNTILSHNKESCKLDKNYKIWLVSAEMKRNGQCFLLPSTTRN